MIEKTLEKREYCSAVFLNVCQAFDRVWHDGLLNKIKKFISEYSLFLKSYLEDRQSRVRHDNENSSNFEIRAGVPLGSVLESLLYQIFTADFPTDDDATLTATFADDAAILAANRDPFVASYNLQGSLDLIHAWLQK